MFARTRWSSRVRKIIFVQRNCHIRSVHAVPARLEPGLGSAAEHAASVRVDTGAAGSARDSLPGYLPRPARGAKRHEAVRGGGTMHVAPAQLKLGGHALAILAPAAGHVHRVWDYAAVTSHRKNPAVQKERKAEETGVKEIKKTHRNPIAPSTGEEHCGHRRRPPLSPAHFPPDGTVRERVCGWVGGGVKQKKTGAINVRFSKRAPTSASTPPSLTADSLDLAAGVPESRVRAGSGLGGGVGRMKGKGEYVVSNHLRWKGGGVKQKRGEQRRRVCGWTSGVVRAWGGGRAAGERDVQQAVSSRRKSTAEQSMEAFLIGQVRIWDELGVLGDECGAVDRLDDDAVDAVLLLLATGFGGAYLRGPFARSAYEMGALGAAIAVNLNPIPRDGHRRTVWL
ncbi:hypothetical protein C8J57DRAFT_1485356 [Mycena rebaudengoi]|nr:hypothetical protein C8J57DRAFT_1485356 [Mycena rebaudengoi]